MAISYVGGQDGGRAGVNNTQTVNFSLVGGTNSTPSANDLVIITTVVGSQARNPAQAVSGYTALGQLNPTAATYDTSLNVSYKFMGSTPDTSFALPSTGNNADAQSYTVQVFRGVNLATPLDVAVVSATNTGTSRPDPGAIVPITTGAWVVICGGGAATTGANYVAPTNFTTNFLTRFDADTNDSLVGSGYWSGWTSGSVNPNAYTGGSNTTSDSWAAYTLALRPQPDTQSLTQNTLFNNTQVFYTPTVTKGTVTLTASRVENSNVFYSAILTQTSNGDTLLPSLYTNTNVFYTATVGVGGNFVLVPFTSNTNNFNTFTITYKNTIVVELYANTQSFFVPVLNIGAANLNVSLVNNTNTFYSANVRTGQLIPLLFNNINNVFTATVINQYPDSRYVLKGIVYGPGLVGEYQDGIKVELTTGQLVKPLNSKVAIFL